MKRLYLFVIIASLLGVSCQSTQSKDASTARLQRSVLCNQLYAAKKDKYWGSKIGQSSAMYNEQMDKCLAYNIYVNTLQGVYWAYVKDLENDATLFSYSDYKNRIFWQGNKCQDFYASYEAFDEGKKIEGCDKTELLTEVFVKIRSYGFIVNDGFRTE